MLPTFWKVKSQTLFLGSNPYTLGGQGVSSPDFFFVILTDEFNNFKPLFLFSLKSNRFPVCWCRITEVLRDF